MSYENQWGFFINPKSRFDWLSRLPSKRYPWTVNSAVAYLRFCRGGDFRKAKMHIRHTKYKLFFAERYLKNKHGINNDIIFFIQYLISHTKSAGSFRLDVSFNKSTTNEKSLEESFTVSFRCIYSELHTAVLVVLCRVRSVIY